MDYTSWITWIIAVAFAIKLFIYKFVRGKMCPSLRRMTGKVVIVTGANTGIGLETAKALSRRGAHVILACRNMEKAEEAASHIREATANKAVIARKLDLASLSSVREFSEQFHKEYKGLDVLINNAGVINPPYQKTEDGFELTMGVNHLGHFLLTNLLLDLLKQSAPSRIVVVSAIGYRFAQLDLDNISMERDNYRPFIAYNNTKLAGVLMARELARRLEGSGVTTYSLHPGVIYTDISRHFAIVRHPWTRWLADIAQRQLFKTPKEGAQTTIYCAVSEEIEKASGKFYSQCSECALSKTAKDDEFSKKLWDVSEKLVGLK